MVLFTTPETLQPGLQLCLYSITGGFATRESSRCCTFAIKSGSLRKNGDVPDSRPFP